MLLLLQPLQKRLLQLLHARKSKGSLRKASAKLANLIRPCDKGADLNKVKGQEKGEERLEWKYGWGEVKKKSVGKLCWRELRFDDGGASSVIVSERSKVKEVL